MDETEVMRAIVKILNEAGYSHQEGIDMLDHIVSYLRNAALKSPITECK